MLPLSFYAKCMSDALMHHGSAASFPMEMRFLLSALGLVLLYVLNLLTDFDREVKVPSITNFLEASIKQVGLYRKIFFMHICTGV